MLKAIKIQIYPNKEQEHYIRNLLGTSRYVYNYMLSYKINEYHNNNKSITYSQTSKKLTEIKNEYEWMRNVHSKVIQQTLLNLDQAYKNFFKNDKGFPKFKSKKDNNQSCRFPKDAISKIYGNCIDIIQKLSNIHFKCSRKDEIYLNKHQEHIKSGTLRKTKDNKFYFSILIDRENDKSLPPSDKSIGIDLGIKDFVITSDGQKFENLKIKRNNEKKLAKLHRWLSRKESKSKNREKARVALAKFYRKLTNVKEHYLHHVANQLLNDNQIIAIETLNVKGMMKNHNLAKSIQEASFSRFKEILKYKAEWYGREIVEIDTFYPSSKTCSCCGYKNKELSLKDREWTCSDCGAIHDRDLNAAMNIRNEGLRLLKVRSSSPELTPLDSSGYALDELGKECDFIEFQ